MFLESNASRWVRLQHGLSVPPRGYQLATFILCLGLILHRIVLPFTQCYHAACVGLSFGRSQMLGWLHVKPCELEVRLLLLQQDGLYHQLRLGNVCHLSLMIN